MRMSIGFVSLAIALVSLACGSEDVKQPNTAKGNATITFAGCPYNDVAIHGSGSPPTLNDYGATVANGNDYSVRCTLTSQGSLDAHIESSLASLDVRSSDGISATMTFYAAGTGGTPEPVTSVDADNNAAPTCTLTTSRDGTLLTAGNGTIFAEYDCTKVWHSANLSTVCHTQGLFYFTRCNG